MRAVTRAVRDLVAILLLAACATTDVATLREDDFELEEDEIRLWNRAVEEEDRIDKSGLVYREPEVEAYLNEVASKLHPPEVHERVRFRIVVLRDPNLNAFAYPNGVVYAHTGILAKMENEAQLATLLAHEMTHCTHRHAVENFRSVKNKTAFLSGLQVTLGGIGYGVGDLVTLLGALGTMAAVTGYSRHLETEADTVGFDAMVKAGYDPREAPKVFEHLKREVEEEDIKEPFFFGTHPRLKERVENYERLLESDLYLPAGGVTNEQIFAEKMRPVLLDNAVLDVRRGRFNWAREAMERYLDSTPNSARAYFVLGEICRHEAKDANLQEAVACYDRSISLDPTYDEPHRSLGLIYYKQGKRELAREHFEAYLRLAPDAPDKKYVEGYIDQMQ